MVMCGREFLLPLQQQLFSGIQCQDLQLTLGARLLIGDVGHIGVTAFVMGRDNFLNVGSYNATTTGNITATVFLCLTRSLYLLGLLGRDREPELQEKKAS